MVEGERVRSDVRSWLSANWDPELMLREWRGRLVDSGWACPSWPTAWCGLGLPPWAEDIAHEEIAAAGAVGTPFGVGFGLAAPTVLAHGSDHLKERLLRPTLTGEVTWCQLFSEPGSGSDLAGLTTRADRDGDEWVLNGQKVWSTSAHHADWGLLLARTDWDAPKHRGITCFALPMRQPGVDVRALRQMNGHASFNEVFLTDARAPGANVIGDPNEGWRVALTTLAHERQFRTVAAPRGDQAHGRAAQEARAEADEYFRTYRWYPAARRPTRPRGRDRPRRRTARPIRSAARQSRACTRCNAHTGGRCNGRTPRARRVGRRAPKVRSASLRRVWSRAPRPVSIRISRAQMGCSPAPARFTTA